MRDYENRIDFDRIRDYLKGRQDHDEEKRFERLMSQDQEMKQTVNDLARILSGLQIWDAFSEGHVSAEVLAQYASNPDEFGDSLKHDVEGHLKDCPTCRAEVSMCKEALRNSDSAAANSKGLPRHLFSTIFVKSFRLRPALAYAASILMIGTTLILSIWLMPTSDKLISRLIESSLERSPGSEQAVISVPQGVEAVELRLSLPLKPSAEYGYELIDSAGASILMFPTQLSGKGDGFVFQDLRLLVPANHLQPGQYAIRAIERYHDSVQHSRDTVVSEFRVTSEK